MVVKAGEGHPSKQIVCVYVPLCLVPACVCEKLYSQGIQYVTMRDQDWIYEQTTTTQHTLLYTSTVRKGESGYQTHRSGF